MDTGPPPGGDYDRGPAAVVLFWVMSGVALVALTGRFIGRQMIRSIGADDWMMLVTWVLLVVFAAFLTKDATLGGMRHLYYLTPSEAVVASKWSWLSQGFVIMGFATGKVSVGLLILRIIGPNTFWRKWLLWFFMLTAVAFSIVDIVLTYVQCHPVDALWNPTLVATGQAQCLPAAVQTDFAIFLSCWNVVVDTVLALLPATIFIKLKLSWKKRIGLCVLLGLGITAAICAAIKTTYLASLSQRSDITWETYNLYVWSGAELFVIIVCGSVPPMKPVYDRFFAKAKSLSQNSKYGKYGSEGSATHRSYGQHSRPDAYVERLDPKAEPYGDNRLLHARSDSYDLEGYPQAVSRDDHPLPHQTEPFHYQPPQPPVSMLPAGDISVPLR